MTRIPSRVGQAESGCPPVAAEPESTNVERLASRGVRTVARNDPLYFDLKFWPTPDPNQHSVDARREQIAAIEARKVEVRQKRENSPPTLLPAKPYCADDLEDGLRIRSRPLALKRRHLQFNGPNAYRWLLHDIDRGDAVLAHYDACLPPPNVIMINPANGHAHCAYLLEKAVARHSASRAAPLRYFAAVERGFARRLGADRRFAGLIVKNPVHKHWRVEWRRDRPYTLGELEDWLWPRDTEPDHCISESRGAGRNCTIFEELRQVAYREVREFKRGAGDPGAFRARLERVALGINLQFPEALQLSEVRAIARSVAKWTWGRFSLEGFSDRQARLSKIANDKRWAGHVAESRTMPWQIQKVSRATYFRQRASARTPSPSTPSQPAAPPWTMLGISRATYYRQKKAGEL